MKKKLSEKIIDLTFVKVGGKCSNIIMDQCKKVSQFLSQNLKLFCSLMYFVWKPFVRIGEISVDIDADYFCFDDVW